MAADESIPNQPQHTPATSAHHDAHSVDTDQQATCTISGLDVFAQDELFCPNCDYSLRGIGSGCCPECGTSFDLAALQRSQIPWEHRRTIGTHRAYWNTVRLATLRSARLAGEFTHQVSHAHAQSFRCMTLARVYLPLLLATAALFLFKPLQGYGSPLLNWAYHRGWPAVLLHFCLLLFLISASGVPSYFFCVRTAPPTDRDRGAALSYYALAPLAWMPLAYVGSFAIAWADALIGNPAVNTQTLNWMGLMLLPGGTLLWWYLNLLHLASQTVRPRRNQLLVMAMTLPLLWTALAVVLLWILPIILSYVILILTHWR